ncbi:hypothetical protein BSQ98_10190 [Serratia liquefaciens]|uniref:hypothetical protein n=1 Tax=Serratia liquefaciens TaxID=614 RepID=UPI00101E8F63|nr:hypothetical protein [Serratia liquefaciens]RYM64424.1 hypothetical protein BSQ98_10190 [Serratia liquefaciens]
MTDTDRSNKKINITELRNAFKEGAIPNEQDYGDLIDLAAVGGRVLGATEEDATAPHVGEGLTYAEGKLAILPTPAGGVLVNKEGVSVKVDGNALATTERGVALRLHQDSGLAVDDNGLHIKTGAGLKTDKDGVTVALVPKSGLAVEGNKLAINLSQTSGLAFDEKGALKVNVNTEEKNNYITSTDKGLAITAEGVTKIKETLKEVSLTALESAVKGTDSGANSDYKPNGVVETRISQALVNAYKQRSNGKIRMLPAINVFPHTYEKINLKEKLQAELKKNPKGIPEGAEFRWFIQGSNDKQPWDSIVKELTLDGMLHLTQKDGGKISVLGVGVAHDKEGPFPVMVELMLSVAMPAARDKSTITLDKGSYLTGETMTCTVMLQDKNGESVDWMKNFIEGYVVVHKHSGGGEWKKGDKPGEYIGTFEAGDHGSDENAPLYKASLELLGWTEKKESEDYYYYGLPKVSITNMPKALVVGQTFNPKLSFISNGTGANGSKLTWFWKWPEGHSDRKEGKAGYDWTKFAHPTSGKFKKVEGTYDGYSYTPGNDDKGCMVKLEVIPIGALLPEVKGDKCEIEARVIPIEETIKHVAVNGNNFDVKVGFPTTGFIGASFTIILNDDIDNVPANYQWSSSVAWVTVSDGVVTFKDNGDGKEVTISAQSKAGGDRMIEYKFSLKKWFSNAGKNKMTWTDAKSWGHLANVAEIVFVPTTRYQAVLMYEWGSLTSYEHSGFVDGLYWTADEAGVWEPYYVRDAWVIDATTGQKLKSHAVRTDSPMDYRKDDQLDQQYALYRVNL